MVQADFGDPVSGDTSYAACLFDQTGGLAASLNVDRAGGQCAGKECWKSSGFDWKDKDASANGVGQLKLFGGPRGKGQIQIKAANNEKKGQTDLTGGVASALLSATPVRIQPVSNDAPRCFEATLDEVQRQEPDFFKAIAK